MSHRLTRSNWITDLFRGTSSCSYSFSFILPFNQSLVSLGLFFQPGSYFFCRKTKSKFYSLFLISSCVSCKLQLNLNMRCCNSSILSTHACTFPRRSNSNLNRKRTQKNLREVKDHVDLHRLQPPLADTYFVAFGSHWFTILWPPLHRSTG